MLVFSGIVVIVISTIIAISFVAPKLRRKREAKETKKGDRKKRKKGELAAAKITKDLERTFEVNARGDWCKFYRSLDVSNRSEALNKFDRIRRNPQMSPEERREANGTYNFIMNKEKEGKDVECYRPNARRKLRPSPSP